MLSQVLTHTTSHFLTAQITSGSDSEYLLGFIEVFNFIAALVALYFAVRILPTISRDARKRSWLFLSLAAIAFAIAEAVGAIKEVADLSSLELPYDSIEVVFVVLFAIAFYYLFTTEYRETMRLRGQITTDESTGLYSPVFFDAYLRNRMATVKKEDSRLVVMFIGIDDFAEYQGRHGYQQGQYVVRKVAAILQEETGAVQPGSDPEAEEVACRYGGDEFTLILGTDFDSAGQLAERLRYSVRMGCSTFADLGMRQSVTASIGLAAYGDDAASDEELVLIARARMLEARKNGKNQVYVGPVDLADVSEPLPS